MRDLPHDHCHWCKEPLLPGELISPIWLDGVRMHRECGIRMALGGGNHILRICSCCGRGGNGEPPDPTGLSVREAARFAERAAGWVQELERVIARERAKKNPR